MMATKKGGFTIDKTDRGPRYGPEQERKRPSKPKKGK